MAFLCQLAPGRSDLSMVCVEGSLVPKSEQSSPLSLYLVFGRQNPRFYEASVKVHSLAGLEKRLADVVLIRGKEGASVACTKLLLKLVLSLSFL